MSRSIAAGCLFCFLIADIFRFEKCSRCVFPAATSKAFLKRLKNYYFKELFTDLNCNGFSELKLAVGVCGNQHHKAPDSLANGIRLARKLD